MYVTYPKTTAVSGTVNDAPNCPLDRGLPRRSRAKLALILRPSLGPELRQGLELFRVVSRTGLQIRREIGLDSDPCGRLYAGDVFCVNHSATVPHHAPARRQGKQGKRRGRLLRVTRLHMVSPRIGWVTGSSKWVSKFQDGGDKPGPIPLRSTLSDTSPVLMVKPSMDHACSRRVPARSLGDCLAERCGHQNSETHAAHRRRQESTMPSYVNQEPRGTSTRTKWLHSRCDVGGVSAVSG